MLLVDDSDFMRQAIQRTIERPEDQIQTASNGVEALRIVEFFDPEIVTMDISMPEMDGATATRLIRALPDGKANIPIVALSAHAMAGDRERYLAQGMDDYVTKPVDPPTLFRAMARVTGMDQG